MTITYVNFSKMYRVDRQKKLRDSKMSEQQIEYAKVMEQVRSTFFKKISWLPLPILLSTVYMMKLTSISYAAGTEVVTVSNKAIGSADKIRSGFTQLIDIATAVAEPILWFYALTACILMATGRNKELGWGRLKQVAYAYVGISLLPTIFSLLRYVGRIMAQALSM